MAAKEEVCRKSWQQKKRSAVKVGNKRKRCAEKVGSKKQVCKRDGERKKLIPIGRVCKKS